MNIKHRFSPALACLVLAGLAVSSAEAQFTELLQRVPASANTVVLWNAEKVFGSEVAVSEEWHKNFAKAIAGGAVHLPADAQQYVMASQMDFEHMEPAWLVAMLRTKDKHDMVYIASKRDGTQDTIAGLPSVLLPSGNYLVQFAATTYGMLVPASRQAVARWIESTSGAAPEFSPYVREAIGYAEESGTEVIMAMDLRDVVDLATVQKLVSESKVIADAAVEVEAASKVLASLRGVMLGITFGSRTLGSIKVDFGEDASVLKGVAAQLLLDALAKRGAMVDDFATWTGTVEGTQLRLSGPLSAEARRKIFSLMDPPIIASMPEQGQSQAVDPSAQDPNVVLTSTQNYFTSVNDYFKDLRDKEPQKIAQYGIWFDKYASKIDRLPLVNVDKEMLDYGAYVSQQLRNASAAIKGIGVRSRVRQVESVNTAATPGYWGANYDGGYYYGGNYYGGPYYGGAYYGTPNALQWGNAVGAMQQAELRQQQRIRTQVRTEERAMGTSAARQIVQDIKSATAQVRRQMAEKYKVDF